MNWTNPKYRYMDEREGFFTVIEESADSVIFRLSPAHSRGPLLGAVMALLVACSFAGTMPGMRGSIFGSVVCLVVVVVAARAAFQFFRKSRSNRDKILLEVVDHGQEKPSHQDCYHAEDIQGVIVRENTGRDVSDMAMWQTYMVVAGEEYAIVIHQRAKWFLNKEIAIAKKLAERWKSPLHVERK